jgi:hypothetical protein
MFRVAAGLFCGGVIAAGIVAAAAADDPKKDALVNDPNVRQSLEPGNTPLGRNPPNNLPAGTDPSLQKAIDQAHDGTTGTTRSDGQARRPEGQPEALRDAPSGSPGQLGGGGTTTR